MGLPNWLRQSTQRVLLVLFACGDRSLQTDAEAAARRARWGWGTRPLLDSRARPCRVPTPSASHGLTRQDARQHTLDRARSMVHRVPGGLLRRLATGVLVGLFIGGATYLLGDLVLGPLDRRGVVVAAMLAAAATGYAAFRLSAKPPLFEAVAQLLSDCRLCVVCGYDLAGLKPQADGCTVCPECGGAWRLRSPARSAVEGRSTTSLV